MTQRAPTLPQSTVMRSPLLPLVALGMLALVVAWRPAIGAQESPSFSPEQIERGAVLARIGDCAACHGPSLAGGQPLVTAFGTLYSDNITPDAETGIGKWSLKAFDRAMRDGVSRTGSELYPALPYEHFTHVDDADLAALYAFLMSRPAVTAKPPRNHLFFPFSIRPLLAAWKLLFLHKGPIRNDPVQSAEWNRGAYLVEGLGHCGACHTPRNFLGAEELSRAYAGAINDDWRATALDAHNPAAKRWTADALYTYLRTGISPDHSAAAGPMGPVIESLTLAPDADVRAISVYIASRMAGAPAPIDAAPIDRAGPAAAAFPQGATVFAGACAACHGPGAPMAAQGRPSLGLSSDLRDKDPTSAIQAVLHGIDPPVAGRGPKMPGFADSLTDQQVAAVLAYARARYTDQPAWRKLDRKVSDVRRTGDRP